MKRFSLFCMALAAFWSVSCDVAPRTVSMSRDVLMDKIKGAWAGQTIGCTYGGPTEFRYNGIMIDDSVQGFYSNPLGYKYLMYTTIAK